jgi:hypothetical protein
MTAFIFYEFSGLLPTTRKIFCWISLKIDNGEADEISGSKDDKYRAIEKSFELKLDSETKNLRS